MEENKVSNILSQYYRSRIPNDHKKYVDPFSHEKLLTPTYETGEGDIRFDDNGKIAGYSLAEMKTIDDIYSLMLPRDYRENIEIAIAGLKFRNDTRNLCDDLFQLKLTMCFRLKGKGGKMYYYKRCSTENGMVDGKMTHSVSYWEDISFIKNEQLNYWRYEGKNAAFFDFNIPEIAQYREVLTNQEVRVLRLLARGFTSSDIARSLKLSRHTIDTHRRNMLRKMEVANTPELLLMAKDMGLY